MGNPLTGDRSDSELLDQHEVKEPKKYKVLLHNDDYTTMDFVVEVLIRIFRKNEAQATAIMLSVHNQGYGVCGVYTAEVAETKVDLVHKLAKSAGYPLKCSMEGE
ncbi:ATP-dependent Clp protease adapter ClpS [Pseudodesulfovibrio sp.]|uniref:ATP-dependent Clp protease adapter ClpS n=1 Tax=unclassified Pseudodesulfovibrio TaxID=2661612 RepID=UPI003AFFC5D6